MSIDIDAQAMCQGHRSHQCAALDDITVSSSWPCFVASDLANRTLVGQVFDDIQMALHHYGTALTAAAASQLSDLCSLIRSSSVSLSDVAIVDYGMGSSSPSLWLGGCRAIFPSRVRQIM